MCGFGDLKRIGLEKLQYLISPRTELKIDLADFEGNYIMLTIPSSLQATVEQTTLCTS